MRLSSENYQSITSFLYGLSSSLSFSPMTLVALLVKHFKYRNVGFISYVRDSYFNNNSISFDSFNAKRFSEFAISYDDIPNELEYNKLYRQKYYSEDFMAPDNLPPAFRGSAVIRSTELPKELYVNTEYFKYLNSLNLYYFMSVYLYRGMNCIGRIGLHRTEREGNFTDDDAEMMRLLPRFILKKIEMSAEYDEIAGKMLLMKSANDNLPYGVIILDKKLLMIYSNRASNRFADEIVDSNDYLLSGKSNIKGDAASTVVVRQVVDYYLSREHLTHVDFETRDARYTCELVPSIVTNHNDESNSYYYLYISKRTELQDNSILQFAKNYKLTNREVDVLQMICKGYNNTKISSSLVISGNTVKTHISNIFRKVEVSDRVSLIHKINAGSMALE